MFSVARRSRSPLQSGTALLAFCAFLFWKAHDVQGARARIEAYPHENARVESTSVRYGKGGGRFADVSFGAGRFLSCRAAGLRIGDSSLSLHVGQYVEVVPRPGACDTPDVPAAALPLWLAALFYALSFGTGVSGLMILTGAMQDSRRPARA